MYYLPRATERVSRETLEQALLEQGLELGRLEAAWGIVRQFLKLHSVVTVSEITGLSIDEVQALVDEYKEGRVNGR